MGTPEGESTDARREAPAEVPAAAAAPLPPLLRLLLLLPPPPSPLSLPPLLPPPSYSSPAPPPTSGRSESALPACCSAGGRPKPSGLDMTGPPDPRLPEDGERLGGGGTGENEDDELPTPPLAP